MGQYGNIICKELRMSHFGKFYMWHRCKQVCVANIGDQCSKHTVGTQQG